MLALYCTYATSSEPQGPLAQSWRIPHTAKAQYCSSSCVVTTLPLPATLIHSWSSLGFGFITFEAEQSVDQAVNMHFHDIMGKKVCSCSFILPIKSSRVLGDSRSFETISALGSLICHRAVMLGQINEFMWFALNTYNLALTDLGFGEGRWFLQMWSNLSAYCHPRLCLNWPLL